MHPGGATRHVGRDQGRNRCPRSIQLLDAHGHHCASAAAPWLSITPLHDPAISTRVERGFASTRRLPRDPHASPAGARAAREMSVHGYAYAGAHTKGGGSPPPNPTGPLALPVVVVEWWGDPPCPGHTGSFGLLRK